LHSAVVGDPLSAIRKLNLPLGGLLDEGHFYNLAASLLPAWVWAVGERSSITDTKSATALYGGTDAVSSIRPVSLPWTCNPELHVRSRAFHPGFNAEVKSISSEDTWNELLTYVTMSMVDSLFTCTSLHRFYATPPVGYGLVCFPHCAYFVAVEWIGKLFATPFSQPFFLGSDQHKEALAALPDILYKEFVDLDSSKVDWDIRSSRKVMWATRPTELHTGEETLLCNQFVKVITSAAFDSFLEPAGFFRRLYQTYQLYRAAWNEAVENGELHLVPEALVQAKLWYGIFAVAVTMDFTGGREATSQQLQASSSADEQGGRAIAKAVVWLARRGLIYYDLREPNILVVADGSWRLVDYDDMVVVDPGTVSSVADTKRVLQDASTRVPGVMAAFQGFPKLLQFIDDAFHASQISSHELCWRPGIQCARVRLDTAAATTWALHSGRRCFMVNLHQVWSTPKTPRTGRGRVAGSCCRRRARVAVSSSPSWMRSRRLVVELGRRRAATLGGTASGHSLAPGARRAGGGGGR